MAKRKNLIVLRLTTLLDFGGQEKQYLSFCENPRLLQNKYVFAAIGYGGNAENVLKEKGFEVHTLNRDFSIRNFSNIFAVYRLIKKINPDVVHTAAAEANFHGIIAAKLAGVKTIIGEEIGIPNHSYIAKKIFSFVYHFANKVVCVSQSVQDHLVKTRELKKDKGVVIYNPVSVPKQFPKLHDFFFKTVYVGRLEKVKNVNTLIEAFASIRRQNAKLIIVGDGREKAELIYLAKKLEIDHKIDFIGFSDQPSKYVSNADLFVLPSYSEGFGIAAVEAMFLKVPVLATNVGGVPEFIENGKNGWLFNPLSVEELSAKINDIIELTDEKRNVIGNEGFEFVKKRFTVENYIKNLEEFYDEEAKN